MKHSNEVCQSIALTLSPSPSAFVTHISKLGAFGESITTSELTLSFIIELMACKNDGVKIVVSQVNKGDLPTEQ